MAVSEGGSSPTTDFQIGSLCAKEIAPNRVKISTQPERNLNLLARAYIWVSKLLSNLKR